MSEKKSIELIVPLVDEWPLGPPRYPVKKGKCRRCGNPVWVEIEPEYLFLTQNNVDVRLICPKCSLEQVEELIFSKKPKEASA